jgi:hypothetical protein
MIYHSGGLSWNFYEKVKLLPPEEVACFFGPEKYPVLSA